MKLYCLNKTAVFKFLHQKRILGIMFYYLLHIDACLIVNVLAIMKDMCMNYILEISHILSYLVVNVPFDYLISSSFAE